MEDWVESDGAEATGSAGCGEQVGEVEMPENSQEELGWEVG